MTSFKELMVNRFLLFVQSYSTESQSMAERRRDTLDNRGDEIRQGPP